MRQKRRVSRRAWCDLRDDAMTSLSVCVITHNLFGNGARSYLGVLENCNNFKRKTVSIYTKPYK